MTEQKTSSHRALHIVGKIFAAIFVVLFVVFSFAQIIILGLYSTLVSQRALTTLLTDGSVYREARPIAVEEISKQLKGQPGNEVLIQKLPQLVPQVVTESYFHATFSNVIGSLFQYVTGKSSALTLVIDTQPLRSALSSAYIEAIKDAPVCSENSQVNISADTLCRPKDVSVEQLLNDPAVSQQIHDEVSGMIPASVSLGELIQANDASEVLPHIAQGYQVLWRVVFFGTPVLLLLLALAALIGPETLRGHLLFFGIGLLIPSMTTLFGSLFALGFVRGGLPIPSEDLTATEYDHVQAIAAHIVSAPLNAIMWISIGGIGIALAAIGCGIFLGRKNRKNATV